MLISLFVCMFLLTVFCIAIHFYARRMLKTFFWDFKHDMEHHAHIISQFMEYSEKLRQHTKNENRTRSEDNHPNRIRKRR